MFSRVRPLLKRAVKEFRPMDISNAAVGAIAALCVTAGGAAMYVATGSRQTPSTPLETVVTAATPGTEFGSPQVQTFVPAIPAAVAPTPRVVRSAPQARPAVVREERAEPVRTWTTVSGRTGASQCLVIRRPARRCRT
jgi:hypothetical protein